MRRLLVAIGVMAALTQTLDTTITNVALPTIQGNLGANYAAPVLPPCSPMPTRRR
ncbi:MAG TPA: hypothetical protein VMF61_04015 [Candidatus Acidoferrales bacterium]|nr:hypothetical protein [Candidatus Acidoferrales bacterium]